MNSRKPIYQICTTVLLLLLFGIQSKSSPAQTNSTWLNLPDATDWFDPLNWDNGVPNSAGATANVAAQAGIVTLDLDAQVTLGNASFSDFGTIALQGAGPLLLDNPGSEPATVRTLIPQRVTLGVEIATPVLIAPGESLLFDLVGLKNVELSGSIASLEGDIAKTGFGALRLSGDNSTWQGSIAVDGGELVLADVNAVSSSSGISVGPNARLSFVSQSVTGQSDSDYLVPTTTLDGGKVGVKLSTRLARGELYGVAGFTDVVMDLDLSRDSTIELTQFDSMRIQGAITGAGGLSFLKREIPNLPGGQSNNPVITIDGSTSYSGKTEIGPGMRVFFEQPAALGDANANTVVDRGELLLRGGGGNEQIVVKEGSLDLGGSVTPYGHQITLERGLLTGGSVDGLAATLDAPVTFSGGVALGVTSSNSYVFTNGLHGSGSVFASRKVDIAGEIVARGNFAATQSGPVRLSGKLSQAGDVFISETQMELTGDLESPRGTFYLSPGRFVASLVARQSNTLESFVIDPRTAERESFIEDLRLEADQGAVLSITDELRFLGGTIRGAIAGQKVLTKQDRTPGVLEDIRGSGFTRVDVEGGQLTVRGDAGEAPPAIHLGVHDTAQVVLDTEEIYHGDIHLNNASGPIGQAALVVGGSEALEQTTLAGNVFLGDRGSNLSAGVFTGEVALITGVLHGGDLTVKGRQDLRFQSGNHSYSGETHVLAENFRLIESGSLNSTSKIVGNGRLSRGGGRSGLILDNSGEIANEDRIPDSTPVDLNGMKLTLLGRAGEQLTERLGTVTLDRGTSEIVVENPSDSGSETTLEIASLVRRPGTALRFDPGSNGGKLQFATAPTLDDNLLGGWATVEDDFATYGPDGVVAYSALHTYATNLIAATSTDNVGDFSGGVTLAEDKNINALKMGSGPIDLNGHTLTLESGGLLLDASITNGQLSAGASDGAELIVSGAGTISADIVDNAQGSVGLTYASNTGPLRLHGNNTYSGPTKFSAGSGSSVLLFSEGALPTGTDLTLNGTFLRVEYESEMPMILGDVEISDYAEFRPSATNSPTVRANSITIASGGLDDLKLEGDFPITKIGEGIASLSRSLAMHTGPIDIQGGQFITDQFGTAPLDDEHAVTIHQGASLRTESGLALTGRKFRFDGGILDMELRGGISAPIEVLSGGGFIRIERGTTVVTSSITGQGQLVVEGGFGNGIIDFEGDLNAFQGALRFTGGVTNLRGNNVTYSQPIEIAAADLTVYDTNALGTGEVTILPEGRLSITNAVTGNLVLAGGALTMAPGNSLSSPRLNGDLRVTQDSYIFISPLVDGRQILPVIESAIGLSDQTNLTISPDLALQARRVAANISRVQERITLGGDIIVDGDASITSFDAFVRMDGTVRAGTEHASLDLVGNDTFDFQGSIQIDESRSLAVTFDGEASALDLSGSDSRFEGNGTYVGDIAIGSGANIAPGNSAGILSVIGNATIGEGAVFEWEIGSADGTPGEDWDLFEVEGDLQFSASESTPWILQINDLPGFLPGEAGPWLIMSADSIVGFDPSEVRFDVAGIADVWPSLESDDLRLQVHGGQLFLQAIPEPASLLLLVLSCTMLLAHRPRGV
ncbi:autotransporter-associated beta strand repeat-containing protein [Adhaeretor mobilis]|uniref:Autotransporter-associated beta strand repeat protein n=1 Tax=Adhaeretor mobilis TaxID=1930276 RepID=A0A517N1P6_9BACT|nr:autotransporter-associated beta strand repeat-containing protein [Adhaeretor mobilis]QDT01062.1 Autotransporter-associated beta strand repeat protein [Adhaeretor mobilis]